MIQHVSQWEFYHKSIGWELHNLPNIPIIVTPLIDTTLHALADASIEGKKDPQIDPADYNGMGTAVIEGPSPHLGRPYVSGHYGELEPVARFIGLRKGPKIDIVVPQWTFKVRSSGGWRQAKRSPKVSLYLDGGKHICFNFRVSSRPVYKNISEVFEDLAKVRYELSSVNLTARAIVPMDELSSMQRWNEQRHDEIIQRGLIPHPVTCLADASQYGDSTVIDFAAIRAKMVPILSSAEKMASLPLYGSVAVG